MQASTQDTQMADFLAERGIDSIEKLQELFEPHYYVVIPVSVLERKDLTTNAKLIYGEITALTKRSGYCVATDNYIGERVGVDRRTIQHRMKELEERGLITRTTEKRNGGTYRKIFLTFSPSAESNRFTPKEKVQKQAHETAALPAWLNKEAWDEWVLYKKEKRQGLTPLTIKKQLALLEEHKADHVKIIAASIQNGWQGLFPLKGGKKVENRPASPKGKYDHVR